VLKGKSAAAPAEGKGYSLAKKSGKKGGGGGSHTPNTDRVLTFGQEKREGI